MNCPFCATGQAGLTRNLSAGEITAQVVAAARTCESGELPGGATRLSNVVFMGMGEPLLNYSNVVAAIEKITSPKGLGMAMKRITVSTAGIAKMIVKMADDEVKFNLAVSLHSAVDAHPGWETKEKMHLEYQAICKELYKNIECDDSAHKKIIKAFAKEVHIPRTGLQT